MKPALASEALGGLVRHLPAAGATGATGASGVSAAPAWLARRRADAVDRVGVLSVPSTHDEDWRFTDITPLTEVSWQPAEDIPPVQAADIAAFVLPEASARLVFVDGVYVPSLSFNTSTLVVANLAAGAMHGPEAEAHLGLHADTGHSLFAALNMAFLHDGALVLAPAGVELAEPVHLLFVATGRQTASHPRCLVIAKANSALTLVEDHVALNDTPGAYFSNAVAEVVLEPRARLAHVRVQREGAEAFHLATCAVSLAADSRYHSISLARGARLSRFNLNVVLGAEGAECEIDGLALIESRQLADTHTLIDHARPNCISRQLHKCIADDAAHAVFNGKILVRPGAQQTQAAQSSRNLLLSGKARIDTLPQLEILADSVKCAHGATVGQLADDEVFYLRSRGMSEAEARNLLTYAFGAEVIRRIAVPTLRRRLEQAVLSRSGRVS